MLKQMKIELEGIKVLYEKLGLLIERNFNVRINAPCKPHQISIIIYDDRF